MSELYEWGNSKYVLEEKQCTNFAVTTVSGGGCYYGSVSATKTGYRIVSVTIIGWSGLKEPVTPFIGSGGNNVGLMSRVSQTVSVITFRIFWEKTS